MKRVQGTLGRVLARAEKYHRIPNVVRHADPRKTRRRTPVLPSLADVARLREKAPNESDGRLIMFLALTGLRPSEAFGLRWPNVVLTPGSECVRVVEQVYEGERVASAKTSAGAREVILSGSAAALLNEQALALQIDGRTDTDGPVFPSPQGHAWRSSNFNRRVWQDTRDAAKLPGLLLYTLRYFYVSHVRASGLSAAVTMQMVGHTDERTHDGYTRPLDGQEAVIRAALAEAFGA